MPIEEGYGQIYTPVPKKEEPVVTGGFYDANDQWVPPASYDEGGSLSLVQPTASAPTPTNWWSTSNASMDEEMASSRGGQDSGAGLLPGSDAPFLPPSDDGGSGGWSDPSNMWEETFTINDAPSWWRGMTARNQTPETEYVSLMNAMIPFLSPDDQRTVASNLYQMFPEYFASYDPNTWEKMVPEQYEIDPLTGQPKLDPLTGKPIVKTPAQKDLNPWARPEAPVPTLLMQEYQTTNAAQQQLNALMSMATSMGVDPSKLGPGFKYIQQIAGAMKSFGASNNPEEGWTSMQKQKYMDAADPLLAAASGTGTPLSAFAPLAKMMTQPYFGNQEAPLYPSKDPVTGQVVWAQRNPQMWG